MSYRWVNKDPDEVLDYSVDWSRWLGGATIVAYSWFVEDANGVKTQINAGQVVNGIQNVAQTTSDGVVTINLGLGTNNVDYKFYSRVEDSTGSIGERMIRLRIKEQ
jgi:hypothetical protein